jgi:hypothetical protein
MKLFISLLLVSLNAGAVPIRLFHERNQAKEVIHIKNVLTRQYQVPEELIVIRKTDECSSLRKGGRFDLCLNNNGDLLIVSVDRRFIEESLKIFQAP